MMELKSNQEFAKVVGKEEIVEYYSSIETTVSLERI